MTKVYPVCKRCSGKGDEQTERGCHCRKCDAEIVAENERDIAQINAALESLYQSGLHWLKPEYRDEADRARVIGLALVHGDMFALEGVQIAKMAYAAFEDINAHRFNEILNKYWHLYQE